MTDMGKAFASIACTILRLHGMNSNKMTTGYTVYESDNYEPHGYNREQAGLLEQLVAMGYLRKFIGNPYRNNRGRNWRYRFIVRDVNFGLTAKGWKVAEQYIAAAYGAAEYKRLADSWKGVTRWKKGDPVEGIDDWDECVN